MSEGTPFWSHSARFWIGGPDGGKFVDTAQLIEAVEPGAVERLSETAAAGARVVVVTEKSNVPRLVAGAIVTWMAGHVPLPLWRQ